MRFKSHTWETLVLLFLSLDWQWSAQQLCLGKLSIKSLTAHLRETKSRYHILPKCTKGLRVVGKTDEPIQSTCCKIGLCAWFTKCKHHFLASSFKQFCVKIKVRRLESIWKFPFYSDSVWKIQQTKSAPNLQHLTVEQCSAGRLVLHNDLHITHTYSMVCPGNIAAETSLSVLSLETTTETNIASL